MFFTNMRGAGVEMTPVEIEFKSLFETAFDAWYEWNYQSHVGTKHWQKCKDRYAEYNRYLREMDLLTDFIGYIDKKMGYA